MFLPETAVFCITLIVYGAILLLLIYYVSLLPEKRKVKIVFTEKFYRCSRWPT